MENKGKLKDGCVYISSRRFDPETKTMTGKDLSVYQLATLRQLKDPKNKGKVSILARGRATSRACDVAAILEREGMAKISDVKIKTNSFEKENREIHVTEIEIKVEKV